ncbi:MAG: GNAT family N-acetyltransferase [Chloroflexota bacterium]|nr:GNAT family N-acetyltransferase [Chloroflexota bacterium]
MRELELRDASLRDVALWCDLYTEAQPRRPMDPVVERYEWEHPPKGWRFGRHLMLDDGRAVGVASWAHPEWESISSRYASIAADIVPASETPESLTAALRRMEREVMGEGASLARTNTNEDDVARRALLVELGYREDRLNRRWELDLVVGRERILAMTGITRPKMAAQGIRLLTVDQDRDPDNVRKIWRLSEEASEDIPSTLPHVTESLEDYVDWLGAPDMHADRVWIARDGEAIVGISVLAYPPVRGLVVTAWTATARSVRGTGVARALKCETLAQAIALGVPRVRTGNDGANAPILHLNASMGYEPVTGRIDYLKDL